MPPEEKMVEPENNLISEEEPYSIIYTLSFYNCTFNGPVTVNQTGEPPDPPDDPPK